jgi:hypothetical protein
MHFHKLDDNIREGELFIGRQLSVLAQHDLVGDSGLAVFAVAHVCPQVVRHVHSPA